MPTINQLVRKKRKPLKARDKVGAAGMPAKRGVCTRVCDDAEAELSSAKGRARVRLTNGHEVICYIRAKATTCKSTASS